MRGWLLAVAMLPAVAAGAEATAVSEPGRRAQAPSVAVGLDGSIHVIWLDKGTVGEPDKLGKAESPGGHSH